MKRIMFILFTVCISAGLFADLVEEPGFDHNMTGPAYNGEQVAFVSDTLYVTNTGGTDEVTITLVSDNLPAGWNMLWCYEYEGIDPLCIPPNTAWTFNFARDTTIKIDFSIYYNSSPEMIEFDLVWTATSIEDVIMNFTFQTEDYTDITTDAVTPAVKLLGNYPNPFNPHTSISYFLPDNKVISLRIYDMQGRLVKTLYDGFQDSGTHTAFWNGKNNSGQDVSSAVYYYQLTSGNSVTTRKMSLIK